MPVSLDEARHNEAPVELDDLSVRADIRGDLVIGADSRNPVAADGHRLHIPDVGVDGGDLTAKQHEVGGVFGDRARIRFWCGLVTAASGK